MSKGMTQEAGNMIRETLRLNKIARKYFYRLKEGDTITIPETDIKGTVIKKYTYYVLVQTGETRQAVTVNDLIANTKLFVG